jgi:adenylylsulfate reductase subunit B
MDINMPPIIENEKCVKCGICADICPLDIFETDAGGYPTVKYPFECWHCNACVLDCKKEAITLRVPLPSSLLYIDKTEVNVP